MTGNIAIPKEFPDYSEEETKKRRRKIEVEPLKRFKESEPNNYGQELKEALENDYFFEKPEKDERILIAKENITGKGILTLTGKKNIKTLTNWMRKHMEAYPDETSGGFIVKFLNDKNKGFEVILCDEDELGDIKINGTNYKIVDIKFGEHANEKTDKQIDRIDNKDILNHYNWDKKNMKRKNKHKKWEDNKMERYYKNNYINK